VPGMEGAPYLRAFGGLTEGFARLSG
jgi:hypothetical protein